MKGKVVLGMLAMIGILALSATGAQAGSGSMPSPLTSFFVCHSINGDDPGKVLDLQSPVFGPNRQSVRIGNGTLACAWAKLFPPGKTLPADEISPNPFSTLSQLKCYNVSVSRKTSTTGQIPTRYSATDVLFGDLTVLGTENDIQVSELRYICGPADFFPQP